MNKITNINKRAYSLLEVGIVILIISILVTGALSVYFNVDEEQKINENQDKFKIIYNAIGRFIHENGALPCPAPINLVRNSATNFGVSGGSAGSCQDNGVYLGTGTGASNLVYGMIPVQTLNLPIEYALDSYGNKFTYIVDQRFTNPANINGFGSIYPPTSIITIRDKYSTIQHDITNDAVFVIISHGRNSFGSFAQNLASINNLPTDSDELENSEVTNFNDVGNDANFDAVFINKSYNNEIFDDQLFFKIRDQIIVDFRAYNKVFCLDSDVSNGQQALTYGTSSENYNWTNSRYNYFVESTNNCPDVSQAGLNFQYKNDYPIKRCGILGKWDEIVTVNCKNL